MPEAAAATVFDVLQATAAKFGDRPFLQVLPETAAAYGIEAGEITYRAMADAAEKLSHEYAAAGFHASQRVGLLLQNRPDYFRHWFALNALGVSVVPINPDLKAGELAFLVCHSEMVAAVVLPERTTEIVRAAANHSLPVFGPNDAIPAIAPAAVNKTRPSRETECALLYTSGTTGRPKGCVLTNTYFHNSGDWYLNAGGLIALSAGVERMLTPLPLFHMNAMATSTMAMLMSGGCLIVLDRFHPKTWWDSVRASRATIVHYLGVIPPMLLSAAASAADTDHVVKFGFGAGVDKRLHTRFEERFGFPLIEAWAMTETGGGVVIAASHEPRRVGTNCFGRPGAETEVRVVADNGHDAAAIQPGELLVRRAGADARHGFFREYLKDPAATAEAWAGGWFHTGDIVSREVDGSLMFVDRRKNVIRRSGENISAAEVESILLQHPGVLAAAVAATPDDVRGEEVFACIVARDVPSTAAARRTMAEDIAAFCLKRLAYYKAPGFVAFVDTLPLTSTQKIQRGALKEQVLQLMATGSVIDVRAMKKRVT